MQTRELALAAATALTATYSTPALAVSPPEQAQVSIKALDYQDWQKGNNRISVGAVATHWLIPMGSNWSLETGTVVDAISGASPAYYTTPSSFAAVHDTRKAQDLKLSYYWQNQRVAWGQVHSRERDYLSQGTLLSYTASTPDNNTTFDIARAVAQDTINPVTRIVENEKKTNRELLLGITQVLSPQDLVQIQWVSFAGKGYFSDPYKFLDTRPAHKSQDTLSLRWNHHFPSTRTTSRWQARVAHDSFGIRSAAIGLDLAQALPTQWTITPSLRFYSQSSASFFIPPDPDNGVLPVIPPRFVLGQTLLSYDQRLAALGALTWGLKFEKKLSPRTLVDIKYERYRQRNAWTQHGPAVAGLADFEAKFIQLGLSYQFGQ